MSVLDAEETKILESVELGEWQPVTNLAEETKRYQRYAQSQLSRLEAISIQLSTNDLQALKAIAQQSNISVAILMASVLHQYAASQSARS